MKRIDRVLKYKGSIMDVYDDVMQSPTGKIAHWDYVAHRKGAAAVLPVLEDGRILMCNLSGWRLHHIIIYIHNRTFIF